MENIFDRLQFVRHDEVFATREDAYNYVLGKHLVDRPALIAEPMVLLYENEDDTKGPNVILAIGSVGNGTASQANRTFFIDTQKTEDEIEELREEIEEAVKSLTIIPLESDTIEMHSEKTSEGTILSGDVKIADYEIVGGVVNENIIKTVGDKGIYTFVDMDYNPDTFVITFKTTKSTKEFQLPPDQHVVSGIYKPQDESIYLKLADNSKVRIPVSELIEEWTVLEEASDTPIVLTKEHVSATTEGHEGIYDWQDILRGDIRVADHIGDNILHKDASGKYLYVKGTADNIKYKDGITVKEALDNIDTNVSTSEGNLIYKRPDGIYAYAMLDYNTAENKLMFTYSDEYTKSNKTVEFQLNSVKILDDITYDPVKEVIVIRYIDTQGEYKTVEIPAKDIIEEWDVNNEAHNIRLDKYRSAGSGKDILSADAKIHEGHNNILEDLNHELYVRGEADNIKYEDSNVEAAINELKAEDNTLNAKIDQEIADREASVNSEKTRAEAAEAVLDAKVDAETERAEAAEQELTDKIGTGFTSDPHENVTAKFNGLTDRVAAEEARAAAEESRIEGKLDEEITRSTAKDDELDAKIDAETERAEAAENTLDGKIEAIESEIGDGFGPRNTVRDEIDNLQTEIDAVSADSSSSLKEIVNNDHSINVDNTEPTKPVIKVNLSTEEEDGKPNIIKLNNDGLYAGVDLDYVEEANKLIFKTTNGSKEIQLDSMSSIISIEYNPTKEAIVITYMTNGHEIKTVEIPVGDLINEWRVEDGHPHAVQLEKVRVASGTSEQDILKASVVITEDHEDNILVMDDGTLYVSGAQIEQNKVDIEALSGAISTEIARAETAEESLQSAINNEIQRAQNAEQTIDAKLDQEISDRVADVNAEETRAISAETALQNAVNTEVTRATTEESRIELKIDNEISRSIEKDNELSASASTNAANIEVEKDRAISAETALQSAISNEATRATFAENQLANDILAEKTRALSAETVLQTAIDNEVLRAINAESSLANSLNDEITRSTEIDSILATSAVTNANNIEIEKNRAISAETTLQTNITAEETRAISAENALGTRITLLSGDVQNEISRSTEKDADLQTQITQEVSRAQGKEGELSTAITNETLRAQAADNELYHNLADESAARISGDANLESEINQESSRAQVAETTISERLGAEINRSTLEDQAIRDLLAAESTAREEGDAELAESIREATLIFDDTTSIDFTKTTGNVVTADVKLQGGDNIIKVGQGLYATAHLDYNAGTNKIKLTTSAGEEEFQLSAGAIIDNIYYDENTGELVITYHNAEGTQTIKFGVSELFNPWIVQNPSENSAIELIKTPAVSQGDPDELSGRVLLTNLDDNAIKIVNNGLYVSSSDMSDAKEIAECAKAELNVLEKVVIGHQVGEECGSGYTYEPNNIARYISGASSFNNADVMLDASISNVENKVDDVIEDVECVGNKADKIYELLYGPGAPVSECGDGMIYQPYVGACIISAATSFNEADQMLNDQICEILEMWVSGMTCTTLTDWVDEGANKKMLVDVRPSYGNDAEMTEDNLYIHDQIGDYIEPGVTEFTDTNALRIVCLTEGGSVIPDVKSKQNGLYLSNVWDCGLYYNEATDADAIEAAQAAGYKTDNYRTDTASTASNYNYMNNVRQTDIPHN